MKKFTVFMVIFIVFLVGCLLYIGKSIEKRDQDYRAFENDLVEIAKSYVAKGDISLTSGQSYELKVEDMVKEKMLVTNKIKEDLCLGYVTIKRSLDTYNYKPYIKCDKYERVTD